MTASGFLDLSGTDPSRPLAEALIAACDAEGPIFVYNIAFERRVITELMNRFPLLETPLSRLRDRLVDLLPITRQSYYHPDMRGSWSIKAVLPTIAPELDYARLDGVQDGGMAQAAYFEAIADATPQTRRDQIEAELQKYCSLDTYAMVRLWQFLAGRPGHN